MRLVFLTALLLPLLGTGPAATAQIKTEVSDVTEMKRLVSEEMRTLVNETYGGSYATFRAEYKRTPDGEVSWTVSLYGFAEDRTALSTATTVRVQADGQSIEPINVESSTRRVDNSLLEIKRAAFTRPAFEQIATASSVTFSAGPTSFEATRPSRKDLRIILEQVPREGPQTANSEGDSSANPER